MWKKLSRYGKNETDMDQNRVLAQSGAICKSSFLKKTPNIPLKTSQTIVRGKNVNFWSVYNYI